MTFEYKHPETTVRAEMEFIIKSMSDPTNTNVFLSDNVLKDEKKKTKLRKAAQRVLNYYSLPCDQVKVG